MNAQVKIEPLLLHLSPTLNREQLVMCQLSEDQLRELLSDCLCIFREREGLCALLPRQIAERANLVGVAGYRQITLRFSSSLPVPGLTAIVMRELADAGIAANVVSARYHEHILVSERESAHAMQVLYGISNRLQYS